MIVLQHASGAHTALLKLCEEHHRTVLNKHEYHPSYGRLQVRRSPHWDKIVLLRQWLGSIPSGKVVLWLDADSLVLLPDELDFEFDDLAMVKNKCDDYNTGVIFARNSYAVRDFFDKVNADVAIDGCEYPTYEQFVVNKVLRYSRVKVREIDSRFNFYSGVKIQPRARPVIRSWHDESMSMRLAGMKQELFMLSTEADQQEDKDHSHEH